MTSEKGPPGSKSKVQVHKVSPFPISAEVLVSDSTPPAKVRIKSMTLHGLLVEADYDYFQVGKILKIRFELPVFKTPIESKVRVMRTQQPIEHTRKGDFATRLIVEMHFYQLAAPMRSAIKIFLDQVTKKAG